MKISAGCSKIPQKIKYIILIILTSLATLFCEKWDMKRDGIPVLRGKQSKFIFIQMKEFVNQNHGNQFLSEGIKKEEKKLK